MNASERKLVEKYYKNLNIVRVSQALTAEESQLLAETKKAGELGIMFSNFNKPRTVREVVGLALMGKVTQSARSSKTSFVNKKTGKVLLQIQSNEGRLRSFDDIFVIANTYFPNATVEYVFSIVISTLLYSEKIMTIFAPWGGSCGGMQRNRVHCAILSSFVKLETTLNLSKKEIIDLIKKSYITSLLSQLRGESLYEKKILTLREDFNKEVKDKGLRALGSTSATSLTSFNYDPYYSSVQSLSDLLKKVVPKMLEKNSKFINIIKKSICHDLEDVNSSSLTGRIIGRSSSIKVAECYVTKGVNVLDAYHVLDMDAIIKKYQKNN